MIKLALLLALAALAACSPKPPLYCNNVTTDTVAKAGYYAVPKKPTGEIFICGFTVVAPPGSRVVYFWAKP